MAELTNEITELLAQAIRAIQYGHKSTAATYLNRILELDPENMDAWRWLAECMPNESKRAYCLEKAGLAASNRIPQHVPASRRAGSIPRIDHEEAISPSTTIVESHLQKSGYRGQGRAELPPQYNQSQPIFNTARKSQPEIKQTPPVPRKNKNNPPVLVRKPIRRNRSFPNFRVLLFSMGVISLSVLSGYILFSTGLTTGKKVLDWVNVQIENNADSLPFVSEKPQPTPISLFNQPAENPDILATYFPTPIVTPDPNESLPAPVSMPNDDSTRVSAEVPQLVETETIIEINPEVITDPEIVPQPSGYVDGPIIIGKSIKGNNLEVMQFGNGPVERMMVAGVHGGNEWNTTALADELIYYLKKNPQVIPADRTLFILRLLNPDGEARGHNVDGRTNERGVDLNRNWDAFWVVDWPRDGCWNYRPINAGSSPFSEPETAALRDFLAQHNVSALINYHSAALGVFPGGRPPEAESIRLAQSISAVTNYAYPPIDTGCKYTGQFADWLAMNGTAAVDLELTNHTDTDFEDNLKVLDVLLKWEPSTGPKSLTGLINMAQTTPEKPTFLRQVSKFGSRTWNEINALIFGRQEEK